MNSNGQLKQKKLQYGYEQLKAGRISGDEDNPTTTSDFIRITMFRDKGKRESREHFHNAVLQWYYDLNDYAVEMGDCRQLFKIHELRADGGGIIFADVENTYINRTTKGIRKYCSQLETFDQRMINIVKSFNATKETKQLAEKIDGILEQASGAMQGILQVAERQIQRVLPDYEPQFKGLDPSRRSELQITSKGERK